MIFVFHYEFNFLNRYRSSQSSGFFLIMVMYAFQGHFPFYLYFQIYWYKFIYSIPLFFSTSVRSISDMFTFTTDIINL